MIKDKIDSVKTSISVYTHDRLKEASERTGLPKSTMIAFAIDNELSKDKPFDINLKLPDHDENIEYAYADEGGKILNYLAFFQKGIGLDTLYLSRRAMGITSGEDFLGAFSECLHHKLIESFDMPLVSTRFHRSKDYLYYRLTKEQGKETVKKVNNKASRYKLMLKLQKEFEHEA